MFRKIWLWMFPEYILHVKHADTQYKLHVKYFEKKTSFNLSGTTIDDKKFELVSVLPMDYYIVEYTDESS